MVTGGTNYQSIFICALGFLVCLIKAASNSKDNNANMTVDIKLQLNADKPVIDVSHIKKSNGKNSHLNLSK